MKIPWHDGVIASKRDEHLILDVMEIIRENINA